MAESPCTNVCAVADGVCVGCGRTVSEIASWRSMTDAERERVVDEIRRGNREYPKPE
ncbi:DUF1289 domain-containing protein [Haloarcula sp. S1CR25-12]|uniref:DUF1289 domain-containing protein n=1 Tax=Haloarcula saliterrae TaxID=2950534 RepID=A0ABU2FHI4_9EURY|nr:DUF1289 domain-containing protein [Haloarcula sp. S1CR25-12]MDS0261241.1 DUF1289 domain-containing protein [Haloarcula sp. S1CR25-12]